MFYIFIILIEQKLKINKYKHIIDIINKIIMLRLNINNKTCNNEPIHIIIAFANSTICDNLNNICTHIAYNINKFKLVNNVVNVQLIFDYPKIKLINCDTNKMYHEMSKIMKPPNNIGNVNINFVKNIVTYLEENNIIKTLLIYVEGCNINYYHQSIVNEFTNIKTKRNNIKMICIRTIATGKIYGLENVFDEYILSNNKLLSDIKEMNILDKDCVKIKFNNDYFVGSFNKQFDYYIIDNICLIPYETIKNEECDYDKFNDMNDIKYTISMTKDELTIYELCDLIWLFYINFMLTSNKINIHNYILSYEYLNKKIVELHNKARNNSNNDEYRCASFGQYYLNLINEQLIKIEINNKKDDNKTMTELTKYYNKTENKFNNKQIHKKYLTTIKKNIDVISDIKKEIDLIKNKYYTELNKYKNHNESTDFFTSNISLTNWVEEVEIDSSIGLLYKINTSELGKIGFLSKLQILNTTTTFISAKDYLDSVISRMKTIYSGSNLNNTNIFTGDSIGDSNAVIPIYINKYHWQIASIYKNSLISIAISHHPYGWEKSFNNIYFIILINMTKQCFNNLNDKWLNIYFTVMRTCYEIIKENNYNVNNMIYKYMNNISLRSHSKCDIDVLLGQILCANLKMEIFDELIEIIFYNIIARKINSMGYNLKYIKYLKDMNTLDEIKQELNSCFDQFNNDFYENFKAIIYVYNIKKILNDYTIEHLMTSIDENNSLIPNDIIKLIKDNIHECPIEISYLYQMRNINLDWKAVVLQYLLNSAYNTIKNYTFDELSKLDYNNIINNNITFNDANKLIIPNY